MNSLFEYDPPSWYDDSPERQAEITAEHIKARRETGVSNWDLYNLNSYYASLIFTVARESSHREMGLNDEVKGDLTTVLKSAYRIEELEKVSDQVFDSLIDSSVEEKAGIVDELAKIDREQALTHNQAVEKFIFEILPKLPFKENWVLPQVNRDKHGLAEEDYEFIGSTMFDRLATGISKFQEYSNDETNKIRSHPGNLTMKEWVTELGKMKDVVLSLHPNIGKNDTNLHDTENFMKNFSSLWV